MKHRTQTMKDMKNTLIAAYAAALTAYLILTLVYKAGVEKGHEDAVDVIEELHYESGGAVESWQATTKWLEKNREPFGH